MSLIKIVLASIFAFGCGSNESSLDARINSDVEIIFDGGNIQPKAILLPECDDYTKDGLCVYKMGVEETRCWDLSKSFDPDGYLVSFLFDLLVGKGVYYVGPPVKEMCGGYTGPGIYRGEFTVTDNEGAEDSVDFYGIAEEKN